MTEQELYELGCNIMIERVLAPTYESFCEDLEDKILDKTFEIIRETFLGKAEK